MSQKKKPAEESADVVAPVKAEKPQWSVQELIDVAHLGPAVIGPEMFAAAQAYAAKHGGNALGPATRGE